MADVAAGCTQRGHAEITEQSVKNLETGRKTTLSLTDFLVLADVLTVPPVLLLFPLTALPETEVLPGRTVAPWEALIWFTGEDRTTAPGSRTSAQELLDLHRAHDDILIAARASTALATERRRAAETALDPALLPGLQQRARSFEALAYEDRRELRAHRDRMRAQGLNPPPLPADLAHIDEASLPAPGETRQ
ncbi:hypothetical protein Saa2_01186 [Streptomyces acidiscabies]|nr:hypothetical protein Saa2_01186 [Streptomyces acidiscabies]